MIASVVFVAPAPKKCQPFTEDATERLVAIVTRAAKEWTSIFFITLPRCNFAVISLMSSSKATCLLNRPRTTNVKTSRSRRLARALIWSGAKPWIGCLGS
jgi:hypothetical protein